MTWITPSSWGGSSFDHTIDAIPDAGPAGRIAVIRHEAPLALSV